MKTTIEGYIAKDKDGSVFFHERMPKRFNEDFINYWANGGVRFRLPEEIESSIQMCWKDEPRMVKLTIEEI